MSTTARVRLGFVACLLILIPATILSQSDQEGSAHGFPVLRDAKGVKVADGDFAQWIENGRLHVVIRYLGRARQIEEKGVFRQTPKLVQDEWSFKETRNGKLYREFAVNFRAGTATAKKQEEKELEQWSEDVKIEGPAFAGFGFALGIKSVRDRLLKGERVEFQTVGFMPKPRAATVEISYAGLDRLPMAARTIRGDRFVIHPKVPWFADLFVDIPDTHIWLTTPPVGFLRFEGPLAEPKDAVARIDLLPGERSGPATPVRASAKTR